MDVNFDSERTLLQTRRAELQAALAVLQKALNALNNGAEPKAPKDTPVRAGRRPMSAAARKAARLRMLKYWADKRAEAKPKARTKAAR